MAYQALPTSDQRCDIGTLAGTFNKWMILFKFYFPVIWAPGAVLTAFKLYAVYWGIAGYGWGPAGILFAMDALNIYAALLSLKTCRPEKFAGAELAAVSAVSAPLLQPLYAVNFSISLFASRVRWSGYTYRIEGAERITAERGT